MKADLCRGHRADSRDRHTREAFSTVWNTDVKAGLYRIQSALRLARAAAAG